MKSSISQIKDMLVKAIRAKLVAIILGPPGLGKSAAARQVAEAFNLYFIDVRLAQCDPTDLLGFPSTNADGTKACYLPMDTFPIEGDEVPEGYDGWFVFLDEFNSAPKAVQAAAYKLTLDGMVGNHKLHPRVAMAAAGNLETDNAIVEEMSTALQSRLVHMEMVVNNEEWLDWAVKNEIDHRIVSFIRFKPRVLYTFQPDHTDRTYACPRTWEFTNRLIHLDDDKVDMSMLPLLAGTISEGVAREFITFCKIYDSLPKIEDIVRAPQSITVPQEPSVLFALTGAISSVMTTKTAENLMTFIDRLPSEFQVVTLRDAAQRNEELMKLPAFQGWIAKAAVELF